MEQKAVQSNRKKAFRIFYISNGFVTTIFKLKSTNGKQALQTFIKHFWNGKKYELSRVDEECVLRNLNYVNNFSLNPSWCAELEGFATLFSEELR